MSWRSRSVAAWLALGLVGTGVALAQPRYGIVRPTYEPATPSRRLGAELYAGNCATCHGIAGGGIAQPRPGAGGVPGQGPPLQGVGALAPDFYLRLGLMPLADPHEEPERDRVLFSDTEVRSLVRYISALGNGPAIPHPNLSAGSPQEGLQLFTEHCAGCHQIVGRGGYVTGARVPPLQNLTPTEVAEAVRLGPYLMPRFSKAQISDAQLNSLVRYVISTSRPSNRGGWGIGNLGPIPEGMIVWWVALPLLVGMCTLLGRRLGS